MEGATPEHLAREIAECRRQLAAWTRPGEIEAVERRLEDLERAVLALGNGRPADQSPPSRSAPDDARDAAGLRVAVNLRQFSPGIGGTGIYTLNVLAGLAADHGAVLTVFTVEGQVETLQGSVPAATFHAVADEAAGMSIERELNRGSHDVLFCPLSLLDPPRPEIPSAVTIHGLGHEFHPENFDERTLELRRRTYKAAALGADLVLTVSEYSREAIAERFGIDPQSIAVSPPGVSPVFTAPAPLEPSAEFRALGLPEDYLYYPANYWPDKNHPNLLKAHQMLLMRFPDLGLVLTGAPGPEADAVAAAADYLGIGDRVRMLGFVDQPMVFELARFSRAVPYVSQHEGFGIPILEAMHAGAPLVTTHAKACREVGGDAVLSAPWDSPEEIAEQIERLLTDPELAREMAARGKRRARQFSWERSTAVIAERLAHIARPSGAEARRPSHA